MATASRDWIGATLAGGRYVVAAKLEEGATGTVYRGLDRHRDAPVAIHVPPRALLEDPESSWRFRDRLSSLARLAHPHLAPVADVGQWDGLPFAVLPDLPGGTLEDRRPIGPDGGPGVSSLREVLAWLTPIAEALDYVHARGYVHHDVRPGTIHFDAQGRPVLGAFGVA